MQSRTQLAAAASYIPLTPNVVAHQLKAELKADSHIIHIPTSIAERGIFDEDALTSKVGGLPQWLYPEEAKMAMSVPNCSSCSKPMMLVTQLSAPFDFSEESAEQPLPSFCSAILGARQRHDRVLYVFACLSGRCGNAPGTWCAQSICISKSVSVAKESIKYNNYYDDEDYNDEFSTDDEVENNNAVIVTRAAAAVEPIKPLETKKEVIAKQPNPVKKDLFAVGGWSDSEDEQEEQQKPSSITTNNTATNEEEPMLSDEIEKAADVHAVQENDDIDYLKKLLERRDREHKERDLKVEQMKEHVKQIELEERKKQQEVQRELAKDSIVATDINNTIEVLRPFYLYWQEEPRTQKRKNDRADELLQEYLSKNGDLTIGSTNKGSKGGADADDLELDDEYEKTQDKTFMKFSSSVAKMPEQCVRYWPMEKLTMHETPAADVVARMRTAAKKHKLDEHSGVSGMWMIHDVPDCAHCGTPLHQEAQLMPNLLTELALLEDDDLVTKKLGNTYFDWGMVDIYTCPLLCVQDEYVTNFCAVHPSL